jgi:hypothetical protein
MSRVTGTRTPPIDIDTVRKRIMIIHAKSMTGSDPHAISILIVVTIVVPFAVTIFVVEAAHSGLGAGFGDERS